MDVVVKYADEYVFDGLYDKVVVPPFLLNNSTSLGAISSWSQDNLCRQSLTVFIIVCLGGWIFYLASAWASYQFVFDHEMMKHPKFLKNQVRQEIICAVSAIPGFSSKWVEQKMDHNL